MLLSFSVTNFRSFQEEQTLNLLASKRLGTGSGSPHCCDVPGTGEHVLRIVSLYGPNGAGKSNLVQALRQLEQLVLVGTAPGKPIPHKPFLLDDESSAEPTSIELQFLEGDQVFRYGACFDANRVHEEWLDFYEGNKERSLFARTTAEDGTVAVKLGPAAKGVQIPKKIAALAEVGARPNQLFLAEVVNLDNREAQGPHFGLATSWFSTTLAIVEADARFTTLAQAIAANEDFADFAAKFLRETNTGISDVNVETVEVSKSKLSRGPGELEKALFDNLSAGSVFPGPDGDDLFFDAKEDDSVRFRKILTSHNSTSGRQTRFPLHEESDGSVRLLNLLPALYVLAKEGGVYIIDELERSMHPMLARKFVEFFLKTAAGSKSQLIFTTHESTLLDLDLVRRDGIWFAEKDQKGATHLYSLADFKVRNDLRIEKGYLAGRFGAVPFLGGIDHLIEKQTGAEADA